MQESKILFKELKKKLKLFEFLFEFLYNRFTPFLAKAYTIQQNIRHPYSHYIMEFVICTKYYVIPTVAMSLAFYIEYSFNRSINSPHVLTTSLPSRCFRYISSWRLLLASHFTFHIILLTGISSGK